MKKILIAPFLALGIVVGMASAAVATHPTVEVNVSCVDAAYVPSWTVGGDPAYPGVTATVVDQDIATTPTFVGETYGADDTSDPATSAAIEPGETVTLTVTVQFSNHAAGDLVSNSATVTAPTEPCTKPEPVTKRASFSTTAYCNGVYVESSHNAKVTKTPLGHGRFRFTGKAKVVDHVQALFANGTDTRVIVRHVKRTGCHDAS